MLAFGWPPTLCASKFKLDYTLVLQIYYEAQLQYSDNTHSVIINWTRENIKLDDDNLYNGVFLVCFS